MATSSEEALSSVPDVGGIASLFAQVEYVELDREVLKKRTHEQIMRLRVERLTEAARRSRSSHSDEVEVPTGPRASKLRAITAIVEAHKRERQVELFRREEAAAAAAAATSTHRQKMAHALEARATVAAAARRARAAAATAARVEDESAAATALAGLKRNWGPQSDGGSSDIGESSKV